MEIHRETCILVLAAPLCNLVFPLSPLCWFFSSVNEEGGQRCLYIEVLGP